MKAPTGPYVTPAMIIVTHAPTAKVAADAEPRTGNSASAQKTATAFPPMITVRRPMRSDRAPPSTMAAR